MTPSQTMKSKLSTDIRVKRDDSRFMRTAAGLFGLRLWKNARGEYIAKRFAASLMDEDVLVFPRGSLRRYGLSPGLHPGPVAARELLGECIPMKRRVAEDETSFIQLVSVFVLRYGQLYLTYKRSRRLPETRLHGTHSIALGGHLNPDDAPPLLNIFDPEFGQALLVRELSEEVRLSYVPELVYRGLLYDDARPVSRQHLGLVYDVILQSPDYAIGERGFLIDPRFETADEIHQHIEDFENWSVLLLQAPDSGGSANE